MKITLIVILGALVAVLANRLVHVENQRYAMITGMCRYEVSPTWLNCLNTVETRTSWAAHLYYGLFD